MIRKNYPSDFLPPKTPPKRRSNLAAKGNSILRSQLFADMLSLRLEDMSAAYKLLRKDSDQYSESVAKARLSMVELKEIGRDTAKVIKSAYL